ncbi:MAG: ParB/RepB/Spo0J family partition protein [Candidatus Hodarchaeota archaeon]
MKNKRLGKGLEALIPQISDEEEKKQGERLFEVEVSKVRANPFQPRIEFDQIGLNELKQSILENGVIQPITVRKAGEGFELIAGERRLRAIQELGYTKIPAFVMEIVSEDQMLGLALVENIQREDLNPMELAKAYQRLQKEYKLTQEAVAQKVGKDRATVANFIRLLKLPKVIQESLRKEEISMGHARAIMGLPSPGEQIQVWRKTVKKSWSVRRVEEVVRSKLEGGEQLRKATAPEQTSYRVEIEDRLRSLLGTRVQIRSSTQGGRIEIFYYSDDDLNRILELIYKAEE